MFFQTDVVGTCTTLYSRDNSDVIDEDDAGDVSTFTKTKDMASCSGNQRLEQFALNVPDVNIQKFPLIQWESNIDTVVMFVYL